MIGSYVMAAVAIHVFNLVPNRRRLTFREQVGDIVLLSCVPVRYGHDFLLSLACISVFTCIMDFPFGSQNYVFKGFRGGTVLALRRRLNRLW